MASIFENFVYAKELRDARFGTEYTTAFVTSDYHVFRAAGIAQTAGVRATHLSHSRQRPQVLSG
ncbi:hypothetical protein ACQEVI_01795 [Promicromonospora sp. CA-289599]|uniref:hypothetical protein n=1 Tax=Promicromonospora sp. CA-289599 TaxID=3240014 RepID=UPI003D91F171